MGRFLLIILLCFSACRSSRREEASGGDWIEPDIIEPEQYVGLTALALCHPQFPCLTYLDALSWSGNPSTSVLLGTFQQPGEIERCDCALNTVNRFQDRFHMLRLYAINGSYQRLGGARREQELLPEYDNDEFCKRVLKKDSRVLQDLHYRFLDACGILSKTKSSLTKQQLVWALEDGWSDLCAAEVGKYARAACPDVVHVRNPLYSTNKAGADLLELHDLTGRGEILSTDGHLFTAQEAGEFIDSNPDAKVIEIYDACLHGRKVENGELSKEVPDPLKREFRFCENEGRNYAEEFARRLQPIDIEF